MRSLPCSSQVGKIQGAGGRERACCVRAAAPSAPPPSGRRSAVQTAATSAVKATALAEAPPATTAFTPRPVTSVLTLEGLKLPSYGAVSDFSKAEACFVQLLSTEDLDLRLRGDKALKQAAATLEAAVQAAVTQAFSENSVASKAKAAHLFLQRTLYRINRLVLFWYDDLKNYSNERSLYLAQLRDSIEGPWQAWELSQIDVDALKTLSTDEIKERIRSQAAVDVDPPLSAAAQYMRQDMTRDGYRHLLAVGSLDGLAEASRQSRVCGGAANEVMCAIFRVLMEEYGTGRYNKKHSTFFAKMMTELGLSTEPEKYFDLSPWQCLASANHNFLLTERRRHYLRYNGGLTFFEVNGPSVYRTYLAAAQRLGLSDDASGYWELHIKEDERHGRQMVEDVAVKLVDMYPNDAWEVLLGYDQEKMMGERAGAGSLPDIQAVDKAQRTPADAM
ncbi:hypothetical protein WJX81_003304 [Elliptochloris bilobata]|uniref:Iron-containing redox enzyme family protein n=1 Tax=Elliptochloris bilobata TaxID=381761 RepID=A0AAW1RB74_9CHLO